MSLTPRAPCVQESPYPGTDKRLFNTGPEGAALCCAKLPPLNSDSAFLSGLSAGEAAERLQRFGRNEPPGEAAVTWMKVALGWATPTTVVVWLAICVVFLEASSARGNSSSFWADTVILLTLQCVNMAVGYREERTTGAAIKPLHSTLRPEALVRRDGAVTSIDAAFVVPGDRVSLRAGAAVPADCVLQQGDVLHVDASNLTGESAPVELRPGLTARMGTTVLRGYAEGVVTATGGATSWGRTAAMLAQRVAPSRLAGVLGRIALVLTVGSVLTGCIVFFRLVSCADQEARALAFSVVLACASIPIAMRVVCQTTLVLGARRLASAGGMAIRLGALEQLAGMDMLLLDKTGTLTLAQLQLAAQVPVFVAGVSASDVMTAAALATRWWEPPVDAVDALILGAVDARRLDDYRHVKYSPFDPNTGIAQTQLRRKDGSTFRVAKGAPHAVLAMATNGPAIHQDLDALVTESAQRGVRCVAVASCTTGDDWLLLGVLTFTDPLRPDASSMVARASSLGIELRVVTGDHAAVAHDTLRRLRLGGTVVGPELLPRADDVDAAVLARAGRQYGSMAVAARCFANMAPEHKVLLVEAFKQSGYTVGFAGDGANDAAAIRRADCGIAVSGATQAARGAAGLVFTAPGLLPVLYAVLVARQVFARLRGYAVYRVAASVQLMGFTALAVFACHPSDYNAAWPQFFSMPVAALCAVTLMTDTTILAIAYDDLPASAQPERWRLLPLCVVGCVLGVVAAGSTGLLLAWGLQAAHDKGPLAGMLSGRPDIYPRLQTAVFLKLALSNILTVFAARTRSYCWTRPPAPALWCTAFVAACMYSVMATNWPEADGMAPIGGGLALLIWLFALLTFAVQDTIKVLTFIVLAEFGHADSAVDVPDAAMEVLRKEGVTKLSDRRGEEAGKQAPAYDEEGGGIPMNDSLPARPGFAQAPYAGSSSDEAEDLGSASPALGGAAVPTPAASPPAASTVRHRRHRGGARDGFEAVLGVSDARGVIVEGAPWLRGFETVMHEDYRTLVSVFDWPALLRGAMPGHGGPARALDVGVGVGSFTAALARSGGLGDTSFVTDLMDPSEYALRVSAQRLADPFTAGVAIQGRAQGLDAARGTYDIAWAVHSLYTLTKPDLRAALLRLVAAVRPGGVLAIVQGARDGHMCRLHSRILHHCRDSATVSSRTAAAQAPHLVAAEDIEAELRAAGMRFRVAEFGHTTAIPAADTDLLEAYLQGCALSGGGTVAPSLKEMQQSRLVGQYLRSQRDFQKTTYHFSQRVKILLVLV